MNFNLKYITAYGNLTNLIKLSIITFNILNHRSYM
jgi:hypothetical protein